MRAALIGNIDDTDPGLVGHALRSRGFSFTEFARENPGDWPSLTGFDLVVSLGSAWSTYWPDLHEVTSAERAVLAEAHLQGVPVLGICFGGQQLATVVGGSVHRSQAHEIGWHEVKSLPDNDFPGSETLSGAWFQWHYDSFVLPPTVPALATSSVSAQAFRRGRSLGLQFHPEVTESIVTHWSRGPGAEELTAAGVDRDELLERTRGMVEQTRPRTDALVDWFLRVSAQAHETQR